MKSIKERSEEYSSGYMNLDRQQVAKQALEYGANYVLEEIENVIKSDRILGHPFPSLEMRYNQIMDAIEQLKK